MDSTDLESRGAVQMTSLRSNSERIAFDNIREGAGGTAVSGVAASPKPALVVTRTAPEALSSPAWAVFPGGKDDGDTKDDAQKGGQDGAHESGQGEVEGQEEEQDRVEVVRKAVAVEQGEGWEQEQQQEQEEENHEKDEDVKQQEERDGEEEEMQQQQQQQQQQQE